MSIVDKSSIGLGGRQFHIDVAPGEVSTVALMPGDPFRVPLVAEYLEDAREVAHKREHRTMVGTYKGRQITVTSTGHGLPVDRDRGRGAGPRRRHVVHPRRQHGRAPAGHRSGRPDRQPGLVPQRRHDRHVRPEGLSGRARPGAHAGPRAGRPRPRPEARPRRPRRPQRHRRRVLRRVAGVDASRCRRSGCSTSRWSRRRCSSSPGSAACGPG